ncbi:Ig-like domain-containing protein [Mycolicibacterium arseniciresistens]|uniref:Ig-like domain-containing protein n=1 Tax=Mycolicibacterium arseniciresistens TaxID=3062257 RepID=A0ABT8UIM4_9MYCO|nr:Ig-like domain-containing protein [Mycolicibacterium arseniciresistens]MDO3637628.1 Ig-like domain-containing protein [Mycolicibacterium arseniciresistens]
MGQHSAVNAATHRTIFTGQAAGAANYVGRVGALAVALGIGAAVAGGGVASADDSTGTDSQSSSGAKQAAAKDNSTNESADGAKAGRVSDGVKLTKPRSPRLPRLQQSDGGRGTAAARRAARSDDTRISTATADRTGSADGATKSEQAAEAGDRAPFSERLSAAIRALVPAEISSPADPFDGSSPTSGRGDTNVDSRTRAPARPQNTRTLSDQVRTVVQDRATVERAGRAPVDAPTAPGPAASISAAGLTVQRVVTESVAFTTEITTPRSVAPPARQVTTSVSSLLAAVGLTSPAGARTGDLPAAPNLAMLGVLQMLRRETENALLTNASTVAPNTVAPRSLVTAAAATTVVTPRPGDYVSTPYGNIGTWMLKSDGQISNYGGATDGGRPLLEPVNVIIIDDTSTTREESTRRLNRALAVSGYPVETPHSTGFKGLINGQTYGQQPSGFLQAYGNGGSPNVHGRMFGPAPDADGQGYVWTGAFSTQGTTHGYLSFDSARDDLAQSLIDSGAAEQVDVVDMGNGGITGDHDGTAIVLRLKDTLPNTAPVATVTKNAPSTTTGTVTGKVTAVDAEKDKFTYAGSTTDQGTVTVTSTGSWTYTPTAAARHAAAKTGAPEAAKTDTFTITVTDEYGGVDVEQVTVNIVPKNTAPSSVRATVNKADPVGGTATGKVAVTDADGDTITYTASQPANGSVVFAPDGTFVYTPTDAARERARATSITDTDKFTVTVDDGHGGIKTVTVTTAIAPRDSAPIANEPTIGAPATSTGAIKGSVTASDPDGDTFTFSGPTRTTYGTVYVTRSGTWTYTPSAAGRRAAATTPGLTDTFEVTVTDKYGATTKVPITVSVLPTAV